MTLVACPSSHPRCPTASYSPCPPHVDAEIASTPDEVDPDGRARSRSADVIGEGVSSYDARLGGLLDVDGTRGNGSPTAAAGRQDSQHIAGVELERDLVAQSLGA
jgi:hypothetical protein